MKTSVVAGVMLALATAPVVAATSVAGKSVCFSDGGKATFYKNGDYLYRDDKVKTSGLTWKQNGEVITIYDDMGRKTRSYRLEFLSNKKPPASVPVRNLPHFC